MLAFFEVLLATMAVIGLISLGWFLFGRLLMPISQTEVYAVVPASGDGALLEQTVKGLLWQKSGETTRFLVVIADDGLSEEGRDIAARLAQRSGVVFCPMEELCTKMRSK